MSVVFFCVACPFFFFTNFPVHPHIPNPLLCFRRQIFARSQQRWPFARTPSVQSVLIKLAVMGYVPQLLNVYTVSTHICVFPIYLEFKKLGILQENCLHFQRQEDIFRNRKRYGDKLHMQIVWRHIK